MTRLACKAHRLASENNITRNASAAWVEKAEAEILVKLKINIKGRTIYVFCCVYIKKMPYFSEKNVAIRYTCLFSLCALDHTRKQGTHRKKILTEL